MITFMRAPRSEARKSADREKLARRQARLVYGNNNDAFNPELWARYTVAILEKYMVAGKLVHRDFEALIAEFGDTVNTRRPSTFTVDRVDDSVDSPLQDVSATNIPIVLNMQPIAGFKISTREASLAMEKLVERHLDGAVKAMAEFIDASVSGQYAQFLATSCGGKLGGLTNANYQQYLTETVESMDLVNCPVDGRQMLVTPHTKALILQNQPLVGMDQRGSLSALEQADIGRVYGVQHYMTQSMRSVAAADITSSAFLINNAAGYQKGDTVLAVDTGTGALATGQWIKLLGKPYRITAHHETLGNTDQITVSPALRDVVSNNDPFTVYDPAAINQSVAAAGAPAGSSYAGDGYGTGWSKAIVYDGATILPKVGQAVTFGTGSELYTIVQVSATKIWLDRALEADYADNAAINVLPPGEYNMCFVREAISLICRNMEAPMLGTGGVAMTLMHAGYPLRIVISYDWKTRAHVVVIDNLMGIKTIDANKGAVLLG